MVQGDVSFPFGFLAPLLHRRLSGLTGAAICTAALMAGCGGAAQTSGGSLASKSGWSAVLRQAHGQTVRFWMYGGDERINAYVDHDVATELRRRGVRLQRVPVTDTTEAVRRVVAERRAGQRSGGGVDLIWINGANFATGKQAGLWLKDWSRFLPNARFVNTRDPSIATDFRVPVDGQESPWQRATFTYAYDGAKTRLPPRTLDALLVYAKAHPGRFTYPAPPDFTGSAFVRQVVAEKGLDGAFAYLKALRPYMYHGGVEFPKSQAELEQLFGNGQVDFAMAYDANFVNADVRKGLFPSTARPFLIGAGALTNVSFVTIPADAGHIAGAEVLANLLLDPRLQARKADPVVLGNPTVLDPGRLGAQEALFSRPAGRGPYVLADYGTPTTEFAAKEVAPLDQRWKREVVRR